MWLPTFTLWLFGKNLDAGKSEIQSEDGAAQLCCCLDVFKTEGNQHLAVSSIGDTLGPFGDITRGCFPSLISTVVKLYLTAINGLFFCVCFSLSCPNYQQCRD